MRREQKSTLLKSTLLKSMRVVMAALMMLVAAGQVGAAGLSVGHAHNDYLHARPLLDALDNNFLSVEVDIFLRNGALLVAHDAVNLVEKRTLQALYLDPLVVRIQENHGSVYGDGKTLILLIDVKSDARRTYEVLDEILQNYQDILTIFRGEDEEKGAVLAIISGNRARAVMEAQQVRYAGYDGRLSDLGSGTPATFMPLISDRWTSLFQWNGDQKMPRREQDKLNAIVADAHTAGQMVRFWATPDRAGPNREAVWQALVDAHVDFINTDDLEGLAAFLGSLPYARPALKAVGSSSTSGQRKFNTSTNRWEYI